jgi:hypothetical protein
MPWVQALHVAVEVDGRLQAGPMGVVPQEQVSYSNFRSATRF